MSDQERLEDIEDALDGLTEEQHLKKRANTFRHEADQYLMRSRRSMINKELEDRNLQTQILLELRELVKLLGDSE
jgi:hypothetical protein